jgi:uncharacterized protein (DUF2141 family)
MKKVKSLLSLLIVLASLTLTGCANFHGTHTSVYAEVWIVLAIGYIASAIFWTVAYFQSKSGSTVDKRSVTGGSIEESNINVKWYNLWSGRCAVVVTILTIISHIGIYFSK